MKGGGGVILGKIGAALLTVVVAVSLNFLIFRLAPGDPVAKFARVPGATPEAQQQLAEEFGLEGGLWTQYVGYLGGLIHGDLGVSYANRQPVASNLWTALLNTVPMVLLGTIAAVILGVVGGVVAAARRARASDHTITAGALAFFSSPPHWLGLMLILLLGGALPFVGKEDPFLIDPSPVEHAIDVLRHMLLPALTLALTLFGEYVLIVRSAMLETMGEDYVLTARATGMPRRWILLHTCLRNALLPVLTLTALNLGFILGGAVLIESVFSWPGIGNAVSAAVRQRDYPMLQGAFLTLTLSVVLFNLLADLLYVRLDPRIRR